MPRGPAVTAAPAPERTKRLHWAVRPNAEPLEVGLLADAFAELDRYRPRAVAFDELRAASMPTPASSPRPCSTASAASG